MKQYSTAYLVRLGLFVLLLLILLFGTFSLIQAGSSCVNKSGCLKRWCDTENMKESYQDVIKEYQSVCPDRNDI